ncbi:MULTISPECIES: GGDEF and EAL domain-containing protein [unclassified Nitratiruptor]|uniref:GGDEF and EAL domain-containing protein n=1 Tax=unclassified Nitratiruptor TaxID=2624044 RepID=UPI001914F3BD|nr:MULTISPECIES: GGDEF and EAL domain-containing protein [unclassified Nitratiruptor]BCD60947.1 diguanylate cyclase/phosphodiesterase [Nitratiruptor sp. YY08-10]BCD64879.1 diguanylate cyclase/phosphodiesterase [Nitratiruptor sp. YY08-14]
MSIKRVLIFVPFLVIVTFMIFFYFFSLDLQKLEDKNIKASLSNQIIKLMYEARIKEKDFILTGNINDAKEVQNIVKKAIAITNKLQKNFTNPQNIQLVSRVITNIKQYFAIFEKYTLIYKDLLDIQKDLEKHVNILQRIVFHIYIIQEKQKSIVLHQFLGDLNYLTDEVQEATLSERILTELLFLIINELKLRTNYDKNQVQLIEKHIQSLKRYATKLRDSVEKVQNKKMVDNLLQKLQEFETVFYRYLDLQNRAFNVFHSMQEAATEVIQSVIKLREDQKLERNRLIDTLTKRYFYLVLSIGVLLSVIILFVSKLIIEDLNKINESAKKITVKKFHFREFKKLAAKIVSILKEELQLLRQLEYKTYYDLLTNLPNKLKLEEDLNNIHERFLVNAYLFDIKNFSLINEYYSTEIGDRVLQEFAKQLRALIPKGCSLYRYSADEFIVVDFKRILSRDIGEHVYNVFQEKILRVKFNNDILPINLELQVVCVQETQAKDLIRKLYLALMYAKKKDLNYVEYSDSMDVEKDVARKFEAIHFVKKALQEDNVVPVFQKIVKPDSVSYECLIRIKEKGRLLTPGLFMDSIKNTAFYYELTKVIIRKSCETFYNRDEEFSINFSYRDIVREDIKKYLVECIDRYKVQNRIIIELLETDVIEDFKDVIQFVNHIKQYGAKIAIDDFGSGYNNFSNLIEIKPHYLKIDGSLIKNLDKNKDAYIIVKHINAFAKDLGIPTIAEYVCNETIYKIVVDLGIDGYQGYYIDKPKEIIS